MHIFCAEIKDEILVQSNHSTELGATPFILYKMAIIPGMYFLIRIHPFTIITFQTLIDYVH